MVSCQKKIKMTLKILPFQNVKKNIKMTFKILPFQNLRLLKLVSKNYWYNDLMENQFNIFLNVLMY